MKKRSAEQEETEWLAQLEKTRRRRSPLGHFVDADYEVVDGVLRPLRSRLGELGRDYFPMATPSILGDFVRLRIGDEASLIKFARTWGLLGYNRLMNRDTSSIESWAEGDPVAWIWAHVSGIQTALRLWGCWRNHDATELSKCLRRRRSSEAHWRDTWRFDDLLRKRKFAEARTRIEDYFVTPPDKAAPDEGVIVIAGDGPRITTVHYPVSGGGRPPWQAAWGIIRDVINPNLRGVHPEISVWATSSPSAPLVIQGWDSVMSVVYRHLFEVIASGEVEECRECDIPFVRTDRRQRFCPPPPWARESQCAMRFHKREQRRRQREKNVLAPSDAAT